MLTPTNNTKVHLVLGATDMRKSIDSLSILVESCLELNPLSGHLFVFCSKRRNNIKVLYWDKNGFCLYQKRLSKEKFNWPSQLSEVEEIEYSQLLWLLEGLEIKNLKGHERLNYSSVN